MHAVNPNPSLYFTSHQTFPSTASARWTSASSSALFPVTPLTPIERVAQPLPIKHKIDENERRNETIISPSSFEGRRFESGPPATTRNSFSSSAETLLSLLRRLTAAIPPHREKERKRERRTQIVDGEARWKIKRGRKEKEELHSWTLDITGSKSVRENESFFAVYSSRKGGTIASTIESIDRGPLSLFLSWRVSRRARRGIKATMNNYRECFEQNKQLTALDFTAKWRI